MPESTRALADAETQPLGQDERVLHSQDTQAILDNALPGDLVHPAAVADRAIYIPADPISHAVMEPGIPSGVPGGIPFDQSPTATLRSILADATLVDDESTIMAAWVYQQLSGNSAVLAGLGSNVLNIPNIFRYIADESAVPPYIVFNIAGGPGDSLTADHRTVLSELLWYINLVTLGGDDTIIGPILRQIKLVLHKQGADDFLGGRIIDCWRNNVMNLPPEVSKDKVYINTVSVFSIQATIPDL